MQPSPNLEQATIRKLLDRIIEMQKSKKEQKEIYDEFDSLKIAFEKLPDLLEEVSGILEGIINNPNYQELEDFKELFESLDSEIDLSAIQEKLCGILEPDEFTRPDECFANPISPEDIEEVRDDLEKELNATKNILNNFAVAHPSYQQHEQWLNLKDEFENLLEDKVEDTVFYLNKTVAILETSQEEFDFKSEYLNEKLGELQCIDAVLDLQREIVENSEVFQLDVSYLNSLLSELDQTECRIVFDLFFKAKLLIQQFKDLYKPPRSSPEIPGVTHKFMILCLLKVLDMNLDVESLKKMDMQSLTDLTVATVSDTIKCIGFDDLIVDPKILEYTCQILMLQIFTYLKQLGVPLAFEAEKQLYDGTFGYPDIILTPNSSKKLIIELKYINKKYLFTSLTGTLPPQFDQINVDLRWKQKIVVKTPCSDYTKTIEEYKQVEKELTVIFPNNNFPKIVKVDYNNYKIPLFIVVLSAAKQVHRYSKILDNAKTIIVLFVGSDVFSIDPLESEFCRQFLVLEE